MVAIAWVDSASAFGGWTDADDLEQYFKPSHAFTVGMLIHEDEDCVVLVQNVIDHPAGNREYCHLMTIPRCSIKEMTKL